VPLAAPSSQFPLHKRVRDAASLARALPVILLPPQKPTRITARFYLVVEFLTFRTSLRHPTELIGAC
jgi:hypothetical protein